MSSFFVEFENLAGFSIRGARKSGKISKSEINNDENNGRVADMDGIERISIRKGRIVFYCGSLRFRNCSKARHIAKVGGVLFATMDFVLCFKNKKLLHKKMFSGK